MTPGIEQLTFYSRQGSIINLRSTVRFLFCRRTPWHPGHIEWAWINGVNISAGVAVPHRASLALKIHQTHTHTHTHVKKLSVSRRKELEKDGTIFWENSTVALNRHECPKWSHVAQKEKKINWSHFARDSLSTFFSNTPGLFLLIRLSH